MSDFILWAGPFLKLSWHIKRWVYEKNLLFISHTSTLNFASSSLDHAPTLHRHRRRNRCPHGSHWRNRCHQPRGRCWYINCATWKPCGGRSPSWLDFKLTTLERSHISSSIWFCRDYLCASRNSMSKFCASHTRRLAKKNWWDRR